MNVLHVNNVDLNGRRFNGYDLLADMESRGMNSKQAVLQKLSNNPNVFSLWSDSTDQKLHSTLLDVEERRSMNNLLFPWGRVLAGRPEFESAEIVHYHLIHNQLISLLDLPSLFKEKRSVWTIHDPWIFTGHCIHPAGCEGWLNGCLDCPRLDAAFPLTEDNSSRMWRVKKEVLARIDVDIVVASEFMADMLRRSPLTSHLQHVHLIPFGIDSSVYLDDSERAASRTTLGIPKDDFVIMFRSTTSEFKGLSHIIDALKSRPPSRPTTLVTVDKVGLIERLSSDYKIVELGWVEDESLYPKIYSASDVFLMPSTSESFGMMALEAMAASRPVVSFDGTSLPGITHAPDCGIAVPQGDSSALRAALDMLAENPEEAHRRGAMGREIASTTYSHDLYLDRLESLYRLTE